MFKNGMKGTKWEIFVASIKLFAAHSYNKVSVRDIAAETGIKPSSIYNHFPSKDSILQEAYAYYTHYSYDLVPSIEDILEMCKTEHPYDILWKIVGISFNSENDEIMENIIVILLSQLSSDEGARKVLKEAVIDITYQYLEAIFNRLIQLKRIKPLNSEAFVYTYIGISYYTLIELYINREHGKEDIERHWKESIEELLKRVEIIE